MSKPANAIEALRELVACKDLKDRIDAYSHTPECLAKPWEQCPEAIMEAEYKRRQPLAWAAARAVLAEPPKEVAAPIERLRAWNERMSMYAGGEKERLLIDEAAEALARLSAPVPAREWIPDLATALDCVTDASNEWWEGYKAAVKRVESVTGPLPSAVSTSTPESPPPAAEK